MRSALATRSYPEVLAVLLVAEWLYGEWIRLHSNPEYNAWVTWLRNEFDAVEPADAAARQRVAASFAEAVWLERAFFDAALVPAEVF